MAKYQLTAKVTVSAYTTVEAETLEEAIKMASSRHAAFESTGEHPSETWIIEEADGLPEGIEEA